MTKFWRIFCVFLCFGFSAFAGEVDVSKGLALKDEISKLQSILEKLSVPENAPKEKDALDVKDENFKIIAKTTDQLRKIFDDNMATLSERPGSEFGEILEMSKEQVLIYRGLLINGDIVDAVVDAIGDAAKSYDEFFDNMFEMVMLLKIANSSLDTVDILTHMPHHIVVKQAESERILKKSLRHLTTYSTESAKKMLNNFISTTTKSSFENIANVPSFLIFNMLNCFTKLASQKSDTLKNISGSFFRNSKTLSFNFEKFIDYLTETEKSEETPPNKKTYLAMAKKSIEKFLNRINKMANAWEKYTGEIETLSGQVLQVIQKCLEEKKDFKILDMIPKQPFLSKLTEN